MIRSFSTAGFVAVTFTAAESVWSSLAFFYPSRFTFPSGLNRQGWGRPGALGGGGPGGVELQLRYSLLHWDSHWIQSHCQAWIEGLSPWVVDTTLTHSLRVLNITHWHMDGDENKRCKCAPTYSPPSYALSRSHAVLDWGPSKTVFWFAALIHCCPMLGN